MVEKTQIQLPRYFVDKAKNEAIETLTQYINDNLSDFVEGEEITLRYKNAKDGTISSVNAIVDITEGVASLSVEIGEKDTIKIIESGGTEGIEDKDSLWLSDNWDDDVAGVYPASDLKRTVKNLCSRILYLEEVISALTITKTLGGGDILNSKAYELANENEQLMPEDATYPYTTGSTEIATWDVHIAGSPLSSFAEGGLYVREKYFLKPVIQNESGEFIDPSAVTLTSVIISGPGTLSNNILTSTESGETEIRYFISTETWTSETRDQLVTIERNQKPDYKFFQVEHLLVRRVKTKQLLEENWKQILVGEFIWCIEESALYLKEEAKNGTIQLFKINGQGGVTPTGDTEEITYTVTEDGLFTADATEGSVNVDEDGVLNLIGTVDEDGTLILNDTEIEPGPGPTPPSPTGETSVTAEVDKNGTLSIESSDGSVTVDKDGNFILLAQVDKDGNLNIDDE